MVVLAAGIGGHHDGVPASSAKELAAGFFLFSVDRAGTGFLDSHHTMAGEHIFDRKMGVQLALFHNV